jgi:SOS-response transcriptional repressor LexA
MGWRSPGTVQYFLNRLTGKGAIELVHGDSTDRDPRGTPPAAGDIPILGRIAANSEPLADENVEDTVSASTATALFRIRTDFLLRGPDDSCPWQDRESTRATSSPSRRRPMPGTVV